MKHIVAVVLLMSSFVTAQSKSATPPAKITYLWCGSLYDGKSDSPQKTVTVRIAGGQDRFRRPR